MNGHAFLAASSAGTWGPGGCPAFPRMAQAFPEDGETQAAREGGAAHWWMEEAVRGQEWGVGSEAPNGILITDEMIEGGAQMVRDIHTLIAAQGQVKWALEASVKMPQVHPTLNWGRSDFIAVDTVKRTVHVWDYKFGHGYVDAFENWQLVDYVVGAVNYINVQPNASWSVDMRIYQPRSFHEDGPVKRWSLLWPQFLPYIDRLKEAALEAAEPDAPMRTGSHCDYCPARHACPALRKVGVASVERSLRGLPSELSPENAGLALRTLRAARERLEALETGLEAQVQAEILKGDTSTGWELVQGYGREKWTQPVSEVVAMGAMFGKSLSKPAEVITPAQARKLGIDDAVISAYSEKPKGQMKLRPLDDKNIRKIFQ